jgi:hypothetical protein
MAANTAKVKEPGDHLVRISVIFFFALKKVVEM